MQKRTSEETREVLNAERADFRDALNLPHSIKLSDRTYWMLREKREVMTKDLNKRVSFDDVIKYLFTREQISLRQGE